MRRRPLFVFLLAIAFSAFAPAFVVRADTAEAETHLKRLVARERELFTEAEKRGAELDADNLRSQVQQLCNDYDALLRRHPDFVPAYVTYALLLGKVDMRKESMVLLLRANQLDKSLPIVKNQLGNYLAEEGRPLEAVNYYLAAIDLEPKEPLYHYQLGTLLVEARDDFLKSGQWTRASLDKTMHEAFEQAMQLAPGDWRYAYRYGLSFYDLELAEWEAALQFWKDFEKTLAPGVERETCRLHQTKVLVAQHHFDEARAVLETVNEPLLARQKEKVVDELNTAEGKK